MALSSLDFSVGLALNLGIEHRRCFDFAISSQSHPVAVLCDGANGTKLGGTVAESLGRQVLEDLEKGKPITDARLQEISSHLDQRYPESGATLLAAYVYSDSLHLVGVGDSYASLFVLESSGWSCITELARHLTGKGDPSQLIGAEVPIFAHRAEERFGLPGRNHVVFLMSDGCGAYVSRADLMMTLTEIGQHSPTSEDLNFYALELANVALSRGSRDDISVLILWLKVSE